MTPEERLNDLGLHLPEAPQPVATYVPYVVVGEMVYISGQLPTRGGDLVYTGQVGKNVNVDDGANAARVAALNALSQLAVAANGLRNVRRIVRLGVYVSSAPGFNLQPKVANGASELMVDVFDEVGRHSRSAVGVNELPLNAPVEVEMIAQIAV
jgi:enamine deaminase RidA (YjgF/YER057c/UK114 family)